MVCLACSVAHSRTENAMKFTAIVNEPVDILFGAISIGTDVDAICNACINMRVSAYRSEMSIDALRAIVSPLNGKGEEKRASAGDVVHRKSHYFVRRKVYFLGVEYVTKSSSFTRIMTAHT